MITSITRTGRARSRSYRRLSKRFTRFLVYVVVLGGAVLMIYPLLWLVSASFKPEDLIFSTTCLLSPQWMPGNYSDGWNALDYPFAQFFLNSLIICLGAVVGNLLSCSLAAYAFARLRFKYKPFWFALMLGGILLPAHVLIVPQYILFKELGWRSEEHTSELQSRFDLVCRLLLDKKKQHKYNTLSLSKKYTHTLHHKQSD